MKKGNSVLTGVIIGAILALVILALVILALVIYGLWALVSSQDRNVADWWAVIATLALIPVFFVGFWFGKTEVRGFLSGADKMLDRMSGTVERIVAVRDSSHVTRATRQAQPMYQVVLPNVQRPTMPTITHRELASGDDETIDL